jgi:cysteine desulfurase
VSPADESGVVALEELRRALAEGALLASVMAANNETGVIQPLGAIAELAREKGVPVHTDAVQALGKMPFRPAELGVDLASFSAHKLGGPKGVGALYLRRGTPLAAVATGGRQERDLRAGTENVPGIVGFAEAMALATAGLEAETLRLAELRRRLEQGILAALDGVSVNGGAAPRVANTSNLSFRGIDGESVVVQLDLEGICVSTGSACTTGEPEPSHVLLAMGVPSVLAKGSIRFSLGKGTTEAEIDVTVERTQAAVARLRELSSLRS